MLPDITVVIPTRDRPAMLAHCLEALSAQELTDGSFGVVVVDDGSREPLTPVIEAFREKLDLALVRQTHSGPAAARNRGLARARGAVVAFTDDDCRPARTWLAELLAACRKQPDAMLAGTVINALKDDWYAEACHLILEIVYEHFNGGPGGASFFTTNNMSAPRHRLLELGGFDEGFCLAAAEDRDLCQRWKAHGWPMDRAPRAVVAHFHAANLREFCSMHYRYGRGAWMLHRKRSRSADGSAAVETGFHRHLLRRVAAQLSRYPARCRPRLLLNLLIWQVATIAGVAGQALADQAEARDRDAVNG